MACFQPAPPGEEFRGSDWKSLDTPKLKTGPESGEYFSGINGTAAAAIRCPFVL